MSTLRIEAKSLEPILAYVQSRAAQRRKSLGAPPIMLMLPIELFGHDNTQDVSFRSRRSCRILPSWSQNCTRQRRELRRVSNIAPTAGDRSLRITVIYLSRSRADCTPMVLVTGQVRRKDSLWQNRSP